MHISNYPFAAQSIVWRCNFSRTFPLTQSRRVDNGVHLPSAGSIYNLILSIMIQSCLIFQIF